LLRTRNTIFETVRMIQHVRTGPNFSAEKKLSSSVTITTKKENTITEQITNSFKDIFLPLRTDKLIKLAIKQTSKTDIHIGKEISELIL
jgi:hypothetical protein